MTPFLDVYLEQVAHVIKRWRGSPKVALLFDRCGLGVALDDNETPQHGAVFAGHLLPSQFAPMLAEIDLASFLLGREQHAPAIFRHFDVVEFRPTRGIN